MNLQYWTAKAMQKYGGGFVDALGLAVLRADAFNYAKLKAALPEIFERYETLAVQLKQEDDAKP